MADNVFDSLSDVVVGQEPGRLLAALGRAVAAVESDADLAELPALRGHLRRELANVLAAAEYVLTQVHGIAIALRGGAASDPDEVAEIIEHLELARDEIKIPAPPSCTPRPERVREDVELAKSECYSIATGVPDVEELGEYQEMAANAHAALMRVAGSLAAASPELTPEEATELRVFMLNHVERASARQRLLLNSAFRKLRSLARRAPTGDQTEGDDG